MSLAIDLSGRRALVTGAGQHTGRQYALALAEAGAHVAVNDIVAEKADTVCAEIVAAGGTAEPAVFDVTDHGAVTETVGGFGPDIVVNNTGATAAIEWPPRPFHETEPDGWRPLVDINLYGTLNCSHAALPAMRERGWGRIITIVSDAARTGEKGMAVYGAAKAGAAAVMRSLAVEYGRDGITANAIALGTLRYEHHGEMPEEQERRMLRPYAIKRLGRPSDPVGMLLLLASDAGEWITGQVLPVNGGYTHAL
jgi:3-oxoacyl-[acyl-carrier protein] reductase